LRPVARASFLEKRSKKFLLILRRAVNSVIGFLRGSAVAVPQFTMWSSSRQTA
jgi:hypothetical protein